MSELLDTAGETDRIRALTHIFDALLLCDAMGAHIAACHLQYAADLLQARGAPTGHAIESATDHAANR